VTYHTGVEGKWSGSATTSAVSLLWKLPANTVNLKNDHQHIKVYDSNIILLIITHYLQCVH